MQCVSLVRTYLFFFFSSRRRHTRFDCDWSSDVCSSDLEEEGRRSRIFGELAGSIALDEVLSRTLEAAGALEDADAALLMLPDPAGGKPLVATLGLSVEEAERHAITGPPDGRLARSITMSYTYPELEREASSEGGVIHGGLAVPLPGESASGYLTIFTRTASRPF